MPQFIKMGLGGTGFIGHAGSSKRAEEACRARRYVEPGFPIVTPFQSIEDVRAYLSGDKIICLLCGKEYRGIGNHIQAIHGMSVDQYKEFYNIPWTYGLLCSDSSALYSGSMKKRMAEGFVCPIKIGKEHEKMISVRKRRCPFKGAVGTQNLGEHARPTHELIEDPDGILETYTKRRKRLQVKIGTPEYKEQMRHRPQCQPDFVKAQGFNKYWVGKKQSDIHKDRRFKRKPTPEDAPE